MRSAEVDRLWLEAVERAVNQKDDGRLEGAAVAFGLMGMAWEIYFTYSCCRCTFVTSSRICEQCGFVELDRATPDQRDPT